MSERAKYWSRQVAALEASGLSRAEFCRRRRLNYHTMTYWLKRLAGSDVPAGGRRYAPATGHPGAAEGARPPAVESGARHASFVEVSLPALATAASGVASSASPVATSALTQACSVPSGVASATYEVVLENGRSIRLGAAFDDEAVARLVRTLASC